MVSCYFTNAVNFGNNDNDDDANLQWRNVWWNHVLNLFWQMCTLSARVSYLKWQTVWCHLSNKNLWEFSSSSSIFSPCLKPPSPLHLNALFSLSLWSCLIFSKIRAATKPLHAMHWPELDSKLVFASTQTETATKKKEIQGRSPEEEI